MEFSVSLSDFQKGLQKVLPAMPRKSTLPVLEHLSFSLKDDSLEITATDQDITVQTLMQAQGISNGAALIPGRRLSDIVKALGSEGSLNIRVDDATFEIMIKSEKPTGEYSMKGLNQDEFLNIPELFESSKPEVDEDGKIVKAEDKAAARIKEATMKRIVDKTVFAVSADEFRPAMNGVFFEFRGDYLNAVATDSFRLVKFVARKDETEFPKELEIIVPARALDALKKLDGDLTLSFIESRGKYTHARFDVDDTVFITRLIDEKFPPYESVIPEASEFFVNLNQKGLHNAIKRVSILTSEISHQVSVVLEKGKMVLLGEDEEAGSKANEEIECDYEGDPFEIAFNCNYLEQAVERLSGETEDNMISIGFTEPNRPAIIKPKVESDDLLMLIMPVRLR